MKKILISIIVTLMSLTSFAQLRTQTVEEFTSYKTVYTVKLVYYANTFDFQELRI